MNKKNGKMYWIEHNFIAQLTESNKMLTKYKLNIVFINVKTVTKLDILLDAVCSV